MTATTLRRRHGRRGVGFLMFTLVALPILFASSAMAVDVVKVVTASRSVTLAAENAAVGGAYEFATVNGRVQSHLDRNAARETARQVMQANRDAGGIDFVSDMTVTPTATSRSVQVTVTYRVDGLVFARFFDAGQQAKTIRRLAEVCEPGQTSGPTGGFCTRPR